MTALPASDNKAPKDIFRRMMPPITDYVRVLDPNAKPDSTPFPELGEEGYHDFVRETLSLEFSRPYYSLQETSAERTVLAWRITRELARHLGVASSGEFLGESSCPTYANADPWRIPKGVPDDMDPTTAEARQILQNGTPSILAQISLAFDERALGHPGRVGDDQWERADPEDPKSARIPGIALSPPPAEHPRRLRLWVRVVTRIAEHLDLWNGTLTDPRMAEIALPQMLSDPHRAWPSRQEIIAFEEALVRDCLNALACNSEALVELDYYRRFGLRRFEVDSLIEMARREITRRYDVPVDEARAIMVMRLENYLDRARESADARLELMALKALAIVQGLGKAEVNDLQNDFVSAVRKATDSRVEQNLLSGKG